MKKQTKLPQQEKLDVTCLITLTSKTEKDFRGIPKKVTYKGLVTEGGYYKIVTATMQNNVLQEFISDWRQLPGDAKVEKLAKPYTYVITNSDASID